MEIANRVPIKNHSKKQQENNKAVKAIQKRIMQATIMQATIIGPNIEIIVSNKDGKLISNGD